MKRFIVRSLLFTLPVLVVMMAVNYWVDPANVFSDQGVEIEAVEILDAGENVAGLTNYDERLLQRQWVETMDQCPSTIVLGSSRGMLINRANTGDSGLVNHCVSGARWEDLLGVWGLYEQRQWIPKRVILEVSPYMLNDKNTDTRYKTLESEFIAVFDRLEAKGGTGNLQLSVPKALTVLLSPSYFQSALPSLIHRNTQDVVRATRDTICDSDMVKLTDGSVSYSAQYRDKGVSAQDILDAINYGNGERFIRMAVERQELFESFVDYLLGLGVEVELFITPSPSEVTGSKPALYGAVEAYLYGVAQAKGLSIRGSYSAERYGLTIANFYDGLHPEQSVYDTLLKQ